MRQEVSVGGRGSGYWATPDEPPVSDNDGLDIPGDLQLVPMAAKELA
jgi:hypothetical protein